MSHIKNIEIKNFKSIRHAKIEDCRRVNVFIGYPNVGKSNILEAIGLYAINERCTNFSDLVRVEDLTTLFFDGEIRDKVEVRINEKHRIIGSYENENIWFKQEFERVGSSFEKKDSGIIFSDDSHEVWVKSSFQISAGKEKIIHNLKATSLGKENELKTFKKFEFLKKSNFSKKEYSELVYPFGENIFNIISTNSELRKEIEELFVPYNLELLYDARKQQFTILKRTQTGIFSIPYELVADTLQRVIFYKAAISSSKQSVLLFEEPEAHMFPPYIAKFTADVMYDRNSNQFFIATHSPFVLNDFMEDMEKEDLAIYAVGYLKGETTINRLTDKQVTDIYQYGVDLFFNLEEFLKDVVS
ncbi:MAG: AAA family ATPase [Chitinophagales bacterium]|nr:AAA family ATPase [Chitinophagales bacterium]